jgi:hypothetical protein
VRSVDLDPAVTEQARTRYGPEPTAPPRISDSEGVFRLAEHVFEKGKRILATDGYHIPMIFMVSPKGAIRILQCEFPDQESKYVLFRAIADEVDRAGAIAVVVANEFWMIPTSEYDGRRPEHMPTRREGFMVAAATADGQERNYSVLFTRSALGEIRLCESSVEVPMASAYLAPIRAVWAKRRPTWNVQTQ